MAGESQKPESSEAPAAGGAKGWFTKMPVLVGGVMLVEALVLIVGFKMFAGGPTPADAAAAGIGEHAAEGAMAAEAELVEVAVDAFRAPNRMNGRTYLYDVEISVRVKSDVRGLVEGKLQGSTALVRDRLNRIIAGLDPEKLNGAAEPGLETLRRQVKYQLDLIVGEGLIEEVLVPRCIPYRTDY